VKAGIFFIPRFLYNACEVIKMRSFRKIFISIFAVLLLTGCNALAGYSRAMSFQVNTGDSVRVECTKESGYSIAKSDNGFTVEQKGVVVAYGNFLTREMYDGLLASSKAPNVTILAEDENYYAFLDINPLAKGHTLVIPKLEEDYIFNLPAETYTGLWEFARKVAKAIDIAVPSKRVGVAVLGMEVPHAHIHLVPLNSEQDLDFRKEKLSLTKEEFAAVAESISKAFSTL
jgi:histidine triad (HIT) family protein